MEGWRRAASDARLDWGQENTLLENTFCSKRTHSRVREHILLEENTFYRKRTISASDVRLDLGQENTREHFVREHVL